MMIVFPSTTEIWRLRNSQENGKESFEELQNLFDEMFQGDLGSFGSGPQPATSCSTSCSASSYVSYCESSGSNNKRNSSEMNYEKATLEDFSGFDTHFQSFCFGVSSLLFMLLNAFSFLCF